MKTFKASREENEIKAMINVGYYYYSFDIFSKILYKKDLRVEVKNVNRWEEDDIIPRILLLYSVPETNLKKRKSPEINLSEPPPPKRRKISKSESKPIKSPSRTRNTNEKKEKIEKIEKNKTPDNIHQTPEVNSSSASQSESASPNKYEINCYKIKDEGTAIKRKTQKVPFIYMENIFINFFLRMLKQKLLWEMDIYMLVLNI